MATSPDFGGSASSANRPLTDDIFDALREAVVVVDPGSAHLPLILANATARRCFGEQNFLPVRDSSLYALLGEAADSVIAAASATVGGGKAGDRLLTWRCAGGDLALSTGVKRLELRPGQPVVMLTFAEPEPVADPGAPAADPLPRDLLLIDKDLAITFANSGAARTAGSTAGDLLNLSATIVLPTSGVPREALTEALAGRNFRDDSVQVTVPGAATRWFEVDVQPLKDQSSVVGLAVLSMEVTERRRRRRTAGRDKRRPATEQAADSICVTAPDGTLLSVSRGITSALGYAPDAALSPSLFEHLHPDDVEALRLEYAALSAGTRKTFSRQLRARHQDGSYRWLELRGAAALDNPLIRGVVVSGRDITERKLAETRLAQRDELFKLAAEAVNGIVFEWDLTQGIVHRLRGVHDVLGRESQEWGPAGLWSSLIHPQDIVAYEANVAAALAGERGWTATYRIRDTRDRYRAVLERALIQRGPEGAALRAIGCVVDVSEIKRLTDLLAEGQRIAKMGGFEYSYASQELEWTEEMYRLYETTPREFTPSWRAMLARCPPESRVRLAAALEMAESTDGRLDVELEISTLNERRVWVRIVGHIEKLAGRPSRAFGSVQNIQAQKVAQIALENTTEWLKLSMNMAHMHAWRWDRATDTLEFAIVDGQMVHLPRVFPGMKKLLSRVHPKDRLGLRRAIDHAFERHAEVQQEFRLKSHDGRYRAYAAVARPVFAADQPSGLVGVTRDVTARHEAEARLRRSEELLRTTTANTADTLILVDGELRIRFINRAARGLSIDALVGREIALLLPESGRERVLEKLRRVLVSEEAASYEFEVGTNGGTEYFENRAVLVRDEGIGTGIAITMSNITERKRLEREILDVSSRERQTIGRDLHDGLGQELTGVALMLRGLGTRIAAQCPDAKEQVDEIVSLVNQSIDTARSLARGLLPVNTDGGGLAGALRSLADRSRDVYGLAVTCRVKVSSVRCLSEATANHLYRIAQEALTNTVRHAQAAAVEIFLLVTPSKFVLRISDDGIGIGANSRAGAGMGLKIMKYRASMIGALFEVIPNHPRGTLVSVIGQASPPVASAAVAADAI
jgi:PAS domain S-box-containing protein